MSTATIAAIVEALWPARGAPGRVLLGPGVEPPHYIHTLAIGEALTGIPAYR